MKPMIVLAFIICMIGANASISQIPFQQVFINIGHLQCLQSKGLLDELFIEGELQSTQTFKFFITSTDFAELQSYSMMPHFNISIKDIEFFVPPQVSAAFYSQTLQKYYYKMLWFDIGITGQDITCDQLWTFISRIRIVTQKRIGIIGNKKEWVDKFGSVAACSQFSVFPLFHKGSQEFESFAGWSDYQFSFKTDTLWDNQCSVYYRQVGFLRGKALQIDQ